MDNRTSILDFTSQTALSLSMDSRSDELDRFKRWNLCDYAASKGFVLDRRGTSRHSAVMRHSCGDKLIVARSKTGQYVYFNAKGNDSGTIVDLCQQLEGGSLGDVRKSLRAYGGVASVDANATTLPFELQPSEHDAARVLSAWMAAKPISKGHPYLTKHRGISESIQIHPIFRDRIRIDGRGNMVVPHYNRAGLCGFEVKNGNGQGTSFTGFSPGGVKALACSRPQAGDREMIVCETSVDMFSYATLFGVGGKRFFSTAGQISPMQAECLRLAAAKMPADARVVLAFDNDDGGHKLATQIRAALDSVAISVTEHFPPRDGADWNDVLRERHQDAKPATRLG